MPLDYEVESVIMKYNKIMHSTQLSAGGGQVGIDTLQLGIIIFGTSFN